MQYDFNNNEIIKVIQVSKEQIPAAFIEAVKKNITPTWDVRVNEIDDIYSIEDIGQYIHWENEPELDPFESIIQALEVAGAAKEAGYFQFVD